MSLPETINDGDAGHIAAHATLKTEYDAASASPAIAAYTSTTTASQHATIHNALHTRHNVLGSATTLPTNLTGTSSGFLAHHVALDKAYNLRNAPATPPQNILTAQTPSNPLLNDGQPVTLGTVFSSTSAGNITGVRFYAASTLPSSAIGLLYSNTGTELARATFTGITAGWNTATFPTPVAVTASTVYRVAYWSASTYVLSSSLFPIANQALTATASGYAYGATPTFPTNASTDLYFADVLFAPATDVSGGGTGGGTFAAVTHGSQITPDVVGPWVIQGVAKGSESMVALGGPTRGYWRFDAPDEFLPTTAWPANANDANPSVLNSPALRGGVVTGSPVTIDGFSVPVGTRIVQYKTFPDGYDFYAQGTSLKVLFRGCRFRWSSGVSGSGIFNDSGSTSAQQVMMHFCDIGLLSLDPPNGSQALMHLKMLGGSGHRFLRNYYTNSSTFFQPNSPGYRVIENYVGGYIYAYGEKGTTGTGPDSTTYHLNGLSSEGGGSNAQILRNRIVCASPDGSTGSTGTAAGQIGYGTQAGQVGYGAGTEPGRLTTQTDNIAIFAITGSNNGITITDNYLGGSGYCIYAGNADGAAQNIVVTGNKFTTRYWTNGANHGVITDVPTWGSNGNVQSGNVWADDYGTGGDGCTAPANRQYPSGNGPRTGTAAI